VSFLIEEDKKSNDPDKHIEVQNKEGADKEDTLIDFSNIKSKFSGLFKQSKEKSQGKQNFLGKDSSSPNSLNKSSQKSDNISVDIKQIGQELKKHSRWLIPLVCILIAVTVSIYLRTMPQRLPIAEEWAENGVYNYYQSLIGSQIGQEYPNLPQQNKDAIIKKELEVYLKENKPEVKQQIESLAKEYRSIFKDDEGTLYLLGIDPYYYYQQTEYIVENGYPGTSIKDGKSWDDYRVAPLGREADWNFHNWFGALWHDIANLFGDFPLMLTFFFVGTIFSALTVIPGFFIGKRITKSNAGGFFTAFLLAVSAFFVSRTTGESSDTDVYAVFFPVLIAWLFIEYLEAKTKKWKIIYISLAGLATGVFAFAWTGWWYIATFLVATLIFQLGYVILTNLKTIPQTIKSKKFLEPLSTFGLYAVVTAVFVSIFSSTDQIIRIIKGPFQFLLLKAVAVTTYWPNIRTTVAELNVVSLSNVIQQLGGKLLFVLAIIGIILLILRKTKNGKRDLQIPFLLVLWLSTSLFGTTKGVRFILQATPIMAIALGAFMGLVFEYSSKWVAKELKFNLNITKVLVFVILALLLIQPAKDGYNQAYRSAPSMNDAWYNTLIKINQETPENIVITSWWDFGHWFKAIAERPVTFDGGTQLPWDAYWVGKSLLTNKEKVSVGIVRMLNCGQNQAFDELDKVLSDTPKSIDILNQVIIQDEASAAQTLNQAGLSSEQAADVLQYTHCENPPQDYYITSDDMIGKAGVWGHFGHWDFTKSVMYQKTNKLSRSEAVKYLTQNFNLSDDEADKIHSEIQTTNPDSWISPWPGYYSGLNPCQTKDPKTLLCEAAVEGNPFQVEISLDDHDLSLVNNPNIYPNSLVYATQDGIEEREFSGQKIGISFVLVPTGEESYGLMLTDPAQANSMFTKLFYFDGHGTSCFSKFDETKQFGGGKIITWIMDYNCQQENKVYFK